MIEKLHEASLKSEHAYRRLVVPGLGDMREAGADRDRPGGPVGDLRRSPGDCLLRPGHRAARLRKAVTPGRAAPAITPIRTGSPGRRTGRSVTERSRIVVDMTGVKGMVTVAMMAGLLAGPVAAPNRRPGRPRPGFYPWHVFMDWLGYRRQVRQGSGSTNERRRSKAR